jgi:hypothetical protein
MFVAHDCDRRLRGWFSSQTSDFLRGTGMQGTFSGFTLIFGSHEYFLVRVSFRLKPRFGA